MSRRSPAPLRYCLDAGISYRVAESLRLVGHDVIHVSEVEELLTGKEHAKGQCNAQDIDIAKWCASNGYVLVAIDDDHTGRPTRGYALRDAGVEVIWFSDDIKGLPEQHRQVTERLPRWQVVLGRETRQPRLWLQHLSRKDPVLGDGKRRRANQRRPPAASSA